MSDNKAEIALMQKDIETLKEDIQEIKENLQMLTKALLDPDKGAIARTNRNTRFRLWAEKLVWIIVAALIGVVAKLFKG